MAHYIATDEFMDEAHQLFFWSNESGWVESLEMASRFTSADIGVLRLPLNGFWVSESDARALLKFPKEG